MESPSVDEPITAATDNTDHESARSRSARACALLTLLIVIASTVVGCESQTDDEPTPSSAGPAPFSDPTPVSGRWNPGNDGTTFEPCTALTASDIRSLGADPTTWTDVSMTSQGSRGCRATSETETITLQVIDASSETLYGSTVASKAGKSNLYRYNRDNTCAAVRYSGSSLVSAAVSADLDELTDQHHSVVDPCNKAANVLQRVEPDLPRAADDPQFAFARTTGTAVSYTRLIQVGRLNDQKVEGSDTPVVDHQGRLLPYDELIRIDPQDPSIGVAAVSELNAQLVTG